MTWTATGKVSSKFQLTIPAHIREAMGIRPGDTVRYELGDQGLKIEVVRPDFREVLADQWSTADEAALRKEVGDDAVEHVRELRGWDDIDDQH